MIVGFAPRPGSSVACSSEALLSAACNSTTSCCAHTLPCTVYHTHTPHTRQEHAYTAGFLSLSPSLSLSLFKVQLHTTFHYPPTPPVEGESPDKIHNGAETVNGQLAITDGSVMLPEAAAKIPRSQQQQQHQQQLAPGAGSAQQQQHFQSLPTPPTPELTASAAIQTQQQLQNGGHGGVAAGELQAVSVNGVHQAACAPSNGAVATYGAALANDKQQLYQWQAGSNFCAVMGHPQFAPAATGGAGFSRRPPPLYYQPEKTIAQGPLRSPMSEFVIMKECMDGEWREGVGRPIDVVFRGRTSYCTCISFPTESVI